MVDGELTIDFEGEKLQCCVGDTVGAALTAAGKFSLRKAASGTFRGIFCGMGVCQDCLVTIDGEPGQLACMTVVREAMRVRCNREKSAVPQAASPRPIKDSRDFDIAETQVLIIGGGAAGLTAAAVAAELGAEVVVLDERASAGGQFFKQLKSAGRMLSAPAEDSQYLDGRRLIDRATHSGATIISGALVWGAFGSNEIAVSERGGVRLYRPQRLIVATGAYERGLPVPGWTLPGVMTTGAAQTLLRSHGVYPGDHVLVAGHGPLNLQVALELSKCGANVVSVLEQAPIFRPKALMPFLGMLCAVPSLTVKGVQIVAGLRSAGVPLRSGYGIAGIESTNAGLLVSFGRVNADGIDRSESVTVDSVCMGYGFLPNNELLRALGCRHSYDTRRKHLVTERRADCQTSIEDIYAIGDCCSLRGAPSALLEGVIAATSVVRSLGLGIRPAAKKELRRAENQLRRHRAFQRALWTQFAAPLFECEVATPETLLCRCENVTLGRLDEAIAAGCRTLPEIKRDTRLGMGACQGRYCAGLAVSRLAKRAGLVPDEFTFFAPRAPLKPLRIGDLVRK